MKLNSRWNRRLAPAGILVALLPLLMLRDSHGDDEAKLQSEIDKAKRRLVASQLYDLRYKFKRGEKVRTKVTHIVTVETKIGGTAETARTRSVSTKLWDVLGVDKEGNVTFVHSVESVSMWQKLTGRGEIRFDSQSKDPPPAEYEHVAKSVGKPLATITMGPDGEILNRANAKAQFNPGIGDLAVPLPKKPAKIGQQWTTTDEVRVRMQDRQVRRIKARQVYTLEKVVAGLATISMTTQVLTPVDDPKVRAQLVQRLKKGTIKFDLDAGRVLSKQMDLDETVINFRGADSIMQYLARFNEELIEREDVAAKPKERSTD